VEQARSPPCHPFNANALKASPRLMPATKTHPMASSFPDPATERDATMPAFWYQYQIHKPKITYCGQMARQCISFGKCTKLILLGLLQSVKFSPLFQTMTVMAITNVLCVITSLKHFTTPWVSWVSNNPKCHWLCPERGVRFPRETEEIYLFWFRKRSIEHL